MAFEPPWLRQVLGEKARCWMGLGYLRKTWDLLSCLLTAVLIQADVPVTRWNGVRGPVTVVPTLIGSMGVRARR